MKIITGIYGGRRFDVPTKFDARPTTDLAKQALFNILQSRMDFDGITAADLFSGTGSIAFEMLSRGAQHVTSVEKGHQQQQFILKVAEALKVPRQNFSLVRGDAFQFLKMTNGQFDFVFADPPYAMEGIETLPDLVMPLLADDGVFVLEHSKEHQFIEHPDCVDMRVYGAVHFTFFKKA